MFAARQGFFFQNLLNNAWQIASAVFNGSPIPSYRLSIGVNAFNLGLSFNSDGTKMYTINSETDTIVEYDLSVAWDIGTANYLQDFSIAAQETNPTGMYFKPDGTKMYIVGAATDTVYEYNVIGAWDISSASYLQSYSVSTFESAPTGIFFKEDGTSMYISGDSGNDITQFNLTTAWDVTTSSFGGSFSVAGQDVTPTDLYFKSDGTKMYVLGNSGDRVYEYNLGTAWSITSSTFVQSFVVNNQDGNPTGIFFKSDGTKMFITGSSTDRVFQYNLGTAWNISTTSLDVPTTNYFSSTSQDPTPVGVFLKPDGTKMYIAGATYDSVYEYDLSTPWNISTTSYVQSFSVNTEETNITGVFFKTDGTKMYVIGNSGDEVNEYNLSSAWDISTASYVQNFSVASQDTQPSGIFFKSDGTKMYVSGTTNDSIFEYTLSSAWNISTASYVQSFSVTSQDTNPTGVFFKTDGTEMYVSGTLNSSIYQYTLSTPWNISTATYNQSLSVLQQDNLPQDIFFNNDGDICYVLGGDSDSVWSYDL